MTLLSTLLQAKGNQPKGGNITQPGGFTGPPQGFGGVPQGGLVRPPQLELNNQQPVKGAAPQRPGIFRPQPRRGSAVRPSNLQRF